MKKRLLIILLHVVFCSLVCIVIMYLHIQKQLEPITQIKKLMLEKKIELDEAVNIYLKNNPNLTDSQIGDFFFIIINNFDVSEGVFSSIIEMAEDELSTETLTCMIGKLKTRMQQQQRFYYYLKLGHGSEYFTVIRELELIDKSLIPQKEANIMQSTEP